MSISDSSDLSVQRGNFYYDVFLSHSSNDKLVVRNLAERLRRDGLRLWFDESEVHPGDLIGLKIEQGLEMSRTLVLCISASAISADWVTLERQTALFRAPIGKHRRFIPLRLDDCKVSEVLQQFCYIDWREDPEKAYEKLLKECRPPQPHFAKYSEKDLTSREGGPKGVDSALEAETSLWPQDDGKGDTRAPIETCQLELHIDRPFDTYSHESQEKLLSAIRELLCTGQEIRIIAKKRGSVRLVLEVPVELAAPIIEAVLAGKLSKHGVKKVSLCEGVAGPDEQKLEITPSELLRNSSLYREFQAERQKILEHNCIEFEKAGRDIGFESCLTEWIIKSRSKWRKARQDKQASG